MASSEQQVQLSLGILLDIVDIDWMCETLPNDDIFLPSGMVTRTEDTEETNEVNQHTDADTWRDLALDNQ
ncbi:bonsai [Zostera marina]|uniref:Anaphase-promoting complex subunit 13 n=1 Tax=Zostera marina TaxID=29655 RepID=A0A0K9PLI4_ZOSMR|nr:bonsai [Zostera marina]